jgi:serine/threonine protein kinase
LGITLYYLIIYRFLFHGSNGPSLLKDIRAKELNFDELNYSNELKNLLKQMLTIDPNQRITAQQILKIDLIRISKSIPDINLIFPVQTRFRSRLTSTPCESLYFLHENSLSQGIFQYLSEIPISFFINEIAVKNLKRRGNFNILRFICSIQPFEMLQKKNPDLSFLFYFKTNFVSLETIFIQLNPINYPKHWKIEGSTNHSEEASEWHLLFEEYNQECQIEHQQFYLKIEDSKPYCSFKFSMIGNNSQNGISLFLEN